MLASLLETSQPDLEEDAEDFIQEEAKLDKPLDLNESELPPKPSVELKPLPFGFKYAFLNSDIETHRHLRKTPLCLRIFPTSP